MGLFSACWGSPPAPRPDPRSLTPVPTEVFGCQRPSESSNEASRDGVAEPPHMPDTSISTSTSASPLPRQADAIQQQQQQQQQPTLNAATLDLGLCADLMQSSLQHMTAISLTDGATYQNDLSLSYYGDLRQQQWRGPQGLAAQLLQQLLCVEHQLVAGDVLQAVMNAEPGEAWHRVIRAPEDCPLGTKEDEAQEGMPAAALLAGVRVRCRRAQSCRLSLALPRRSSLAISYAELNTPRSVSTVDGKEGNEAPASPSGGAVSAVMQSAADVSVAMRNAPQMVKSLLELSIVNNTSGSNKSRFQESAQALNSGDTQASGFKPTGLPGRGRGNRAGSKPRVRRCVTLSFIDVAKGSQEGPCSDGHQGQQNALDEIDEDAGAAPFDLVAVAGASVAAPRSQLGPLERAQDTASKVVSKLGPQQGTAGSPGPVQAHVRKVNSSGSLQGSGVHWTSSPLGSPCTPKTTAVCAPTLLDDQSTSRPEDACDGPSPLLSGSPGMSAAAAPTVNVQVAEGAASNRGLPVAVGDLLTSQGDALLAMFLEGLASGGGVRNPAAASVSRASSKQLQLQLQAALAPLLPLRASLDYPGAKGGAPLGADREGDKTQGETGKAEGLVEEGLKVPEYGQEEAGYLWHEVRILRVERSMNKGPLLLIYQTDVTARTELEMTMASMTQAQLTTLTQIFPRHVVEHLSIGAGTIQPASLGQLARTHHDVSILFMDIVGFTTMSKQVPASAVMTFLNSLFSVFDDLCVTHGVHKLETAGDCYIVTSGLVTEDGEGFFQVGAEHDPVESAAKLYEFARDMLACAREVPMPHDGAPVNIRIGIHTGPCTSGVVGSKLPKFGLFGDTMNTASRMESTCVPGRMQLSASTHALVLQSGASEPNEWQATGGIEVKGKGVMETFLWLESAGVSASCSKSLVGDTSQPLLPGSWAHSQTSQPQQPALMSNASPYASHDSAGGGRHSRLSKLPMQRIVSLGTLRGTLLPEEEARQSLTMSEEHSTKGGSAASSGNRTHSGLPSACLPGLSVLRQQLQSSESQVQLTSSSHGQLPSIRLHTLAAASRLQSLCEQAGRSEGGVNRRARCRAPGPRTDAVPAFVSQFQALGQLAGLVSQAGRLASSGPSCHGNSRQLSSCRGPSSSTLRVGSTTPSQALGAVVRTSSGLSNHDGIPRSSGLIQPSPGLAPPSMRVSSSSLAVPSGVMLPSAALANLNATDASTCIMQLLCAGSEVPNNRLLGGPAAATLNWPTQDAGRI